MPIKNKARVKKPFILPKVMSKLIKIALADLKKAEAEPKKYIINMGTWLEPEEVKCTTNNGDLVETHQVCSICAAGAVMAFSMGHKNTTKELEPADFPKNYNQLLAIDFLRNGYLHNAAQELKLSEFDHANNAFIDNELEHKLIKLDRKIPCYNRANPKPFHKAMEKLAKDLEKAGL